MQKKRYYNLYIFILVLCLFLIPTSSSIFSPYIPTSCNTMEINNSWRSLFSEPFDNDVSILNSSISVSGRCPFFVAYKAKGTDPKRTFLLIGKEKITPDFQLMNLTEIIAIEGNFSSDFNIQNHIFSILASPSSFMEEIKSPLLLLSSQATPVPAGRFRTVPDNFYSIFKYGVIPSYLVWHKETTGSRTYYYTQDASQYRVIGQSGFNETNITYYYLDSNYTFNFISFSFSKNFSCTPNWLEVNTSCFTNDTLVAYYNDTNGCGINTPPAPNRTLFCDFMGDNLIGNASSFSSINSNPVIFINNSPLANNLIYTGNISVEFIENNIPVVSFYFNFSKTKLNLYNISIEKETSNNQFGYTIVNGLPGVLKRIYVSRKNSTSEYVCILDNYVTSLSQFTPNCNSSSEVLLRCPGSSGQFNCSINGSFFIVRGLNHSGVKEITTLAVSTCTSNWSNCTNWTSCTNGIKTRVCRDINNCNLSTLTQRENCQIQDNNNLGNSGNSTTCIPSWRCGNWTPTNCSQETNQTRTCTDINNCGTLTGKPITEQPCPSSKKSILSKTTIIIIIVLVLIILIAGIIIFIIYKKRDEEDEQEQETTSEDNRTSSSFTPISIQQ